MNLAQLLADWTPAPPLTRRPYVIAEAGVNHEGSMDLARRLIAEAADAGAQAIKFQTYRAETIASRDSPAYWDTTKEPTASQFELFSKYDTFWKSEFEELRAECDRRGIEFLSTPFDLESATFLADLVGVFKISSSDITNLPFIRHIAGFGKPILLSTGASHIWEIAQAVEEIEAADLPLCLMHCILNYPAADENANLGMLADLRQHFPTAVPGYSDHTLPNDEMDVLTTAVLLGAEVLEKHFTFDKSLPGNDHYHAMDAADLRRFFDRAERLVSLVGDHRKHPIPTEQISRANARRSLVASRDIAAGTVIQEADLTWKRPASGISPRDIREVIGRTARQDVAADDILHWWMFT
jgi:N-acetylneuraminate synthase